MKLYGKNSVLERLRYHPYTISKIYLEEGVEGLTPIFKKAKEKNIPIISMPGSKMIKIARNKNTQGVIADVEDFVYKDYTEILEDALKKKRTLVFLDSLNDPQNLGAIIRSLACLGHFSIILPSHDSVEVTEVVLRVASGGDTNVPIAKVANLNQAIIRAKEQGFHIVGTVVGAEKSLFDFTFPFPLGIVIGSEQKGIRGVIREKVDSEINIPMAVGTLSLNVAQATTIFCYEITKQKKNR
ncbi:MAG TPA: 23S rRNA (guanosine(2251)-2'-O)-methyltransferase RlmB [Candidatus Omnitrophota bacterium]|nr:23S rRNA (guanosine(2251)-2'-O)-methyltransferase RlmB [Candidatus Omnitrophota bacterium]